MTNSPETSADNGRVPGRIKPRAGPIITALGLGCLLAVLYILAAAVMSMFIP